MNLLITGGCGFIGSNFIRHILASHPTYRVVNVDKLTYAGRKENLFDIEKNPRYTFVRGDICDKKLMQQTVKRHAIDGIIHFAAESHVDRSIEGPDIFVQTNVIGTQVLLDVAVEAKLKRFHHISTDEVYGSLGPKGSSKETDPVRPRSPYAATKAASDLLVLAYATTYNLPALVTRCSNNYGPYQLEEKLIPHSIHCVLNNLKVPLYGDGSNVRDWIHVQDHCEAVDLLFHKGRVGEIYNIDGGNERSNLWIVEFILKEMGKNADWIEYVKDRKGHDQRYSPDGAKLLKELSWKPRIPFEQGLRETIVWFAKRLHGKPVKRWCDTLPKDVVVGV